MKNASNDARNVAVDMEAANAFLAVNDLLQMRIMEDPNPVSYYSRINDISGGKLVIAWPIHRGLRLLIHRDQVLKFSFVRDGMPCFFTGIVDETNMEPLPQVTVTISSRMMRLQRRQSFRIKCRIPVEIRGSADEKTQDKTISILAIRTTTYDISAGGVSIRYARPIPEGTLLDIKFALPDEGPAIKAHCRVIHSTILEENPPLFRTGMDYLTISESERARIVRFVYRTQLQQLR